ncbi:MAG: alpha-mannosidase [Actinomycetota bacterium]|nr:alpha-mannosidase [Actinomycetota bacterium]
MVRKVAVVPHTHWDREWYEPYQQLRHRLIPLLDELLDDLEADPGFSNFLLDGQMAVVDDYLEVRPEAAGRLRALAASGRLAMGPWYILMDEFCVSGETMVRNLQLGLRRAADFGGAMAVGYLPDMFGHVAQMPQILRLAGLEHAVVWRGVPQAVNRSAFWWSAPDGSTVRAEYLPVGYSIGQHLPVSVGDLARRIRAEAGELAPYLRAEDGILLMNGTDHQRAQAHVPALVAETDAAIDDFDVGITSLAEYLTQAPTNALPSWTGEMRSGARANLLAGVLSNRTDVKIAAARAERALERVAEPLAALWLPEEDWPARTLEAAWLDVVRNSAHDSICACSSDEVGAAVLFRFSEATTRAANVTRDALRAAAADLAVTGPVAINPSPRTRGGMVEIVVGGAEDPPGAQLVQAEAEATTERRGTGADLARLLGVLRKEGWLGDGWGSEMHLAVTGGGLDLRIVDDRSAPAAGDLDSVMAEAWVQAGSHRADPLRVTVERKASRRVVVVLDGVPGYGWQAWRPEPMAAAPVRTAATTLDNGLARVEVDPATGTFALDGLSGLGRLVDDGDDGDTYTYAPPNDDTVVDQPEAVAVELVESGPVRGRLRVTRRYSWPAAVVAGQRVGSRSAEVVTDLELRAGERLVRVETRFDNPVRDHRLRALFPLPERARHSRAECAFATVTRGLTAEGGPDEAATATFPSRRFVSAGGLTVTHEGLLEYEVTDGGRELALTLLRATGTLSKPSPTTRPNPAGPSLPLEGPQMVGPFTCRYAVARGEDDPYGLADQAWVDLLVTDGSGTGERPAAGCGLAIGGAEVSSLRRAAGAIEVRVYNPSDRATVVTVEGRSGTLVDLTGTEEATWSGSFPLRAWGVATARLDP